MAELKAELKVELKAELAELKKLHAEPQTRTQMKEEAETKPEGPVDTAEVRLLKGALREESGMAGLVFRFRKFHV